MQIEGYSSLSKLASGGMATVYKARQLSLNRSVAIKVLSAEYLWDDEAKTLFDQESLVIAQLNHPNIIHIIDRGITEKGRPYFVMEHIQGSDLSEIIHQEKLNLKSRLALLMQICKGMAAAHKNGVIHRDIKPSNILVDANGHVYILDFGIAWLAASGKPENIVGTPDYMSPEQFSQPEAVTHLSDIYSLGIIMYELFTGQLPPANRENLETPLQSCNQELAQLILQCLQTQTDLRPSSVDSVRLKVLSITQGSHLNQQQKSEADSAINNTDNKFTLLDIIKRNKYGAVFLFENRQSKNLFVIKKKNHSIAGFQQASRLSKIKHPNIINIIGTSKGQSAFIIVMEYLTGGNLQERLSRRYNIADFLDIAISTTEAMKFAHDHDITHGNLRPSNILFDKHNQIKITDFGLDEHYTDNTMINDWYQPRDKGCASKTRDIYSTGAIFYRMLCGENASFKNKRINACEAFEALPKTIKQLLINTLEEDAPNHYQSFDQLVSDLHKLSTTQEYSSKPSKLSSILKIVLLLIILNGLFIAMYFFFKPEELTEFMNFFN